VIKVSGMDWGPRGAEWRSHADVMASVAGGRPKMHRERVNRVPWFAYQAPDGRHVVYFEDATSLAAKTDRLRRRGLRSVVLWSLGSEDPEAIGKVATALRKGARAQKR
jgi:spore germination protein YaaH